MQIDERSGSNYYFYHAHSKPLPNSSQIFPQGGQTHDLQNIFRGFVFFFFFIYIYIYIWSKCYIFSPEKPEEERKPTMSASELLKAHEKELKRTKSSSTGTLGAPMLGRGLAPGSDLFFDGSPKFGKRKINDTERAKVNMN